MKIPSGNSRTSGTEIRFEECPACQHRKWSVSMNPDTGAWHCYKCGAGGVDPGRVSRSSLFSRPQAKVEWGECPLPPYTALGPSALWYLKERGLTSPEKYGIMEVEDSTRILFPYRGAKGKVIFWSTRSYMPDGKPKYMTAPGKHPLYVLPRWDSYPFVILVEGIFDALLTHEATGHPVIALGGKTLAPYLRDDLRMLAPGHKAVLLDTDAMADALRLTSRLTNTFMVPMQVGDPASVFAGEHGAAYRESLASALLYQAERVIK